MRRPTFKVGAKVSVPYGPEARITGKVMAVHYISGSTMYFVRTTTGVVVTALHWATRDAS